MPVIKLMLNQTWGGHQASEWFASSEPCWKLWQSWTALGCEHTTALKDVRSSVVSLSWSQFMTAWSDTCMLVVHWRVFCTYCSFCSYGCTILKEVAYLCNLFMLPVLQHIIHIYIILVQLVWSGINSYSTLFYWCHELVEIWEWDPKADSIHELNYLQGLFNNWEFEQEHG